MKRTPLRKIGKRGRANLNANKILNEVYADYPQVCELQDEGCEGWPLNYCHRHERDYYRGDVELLGSFNQTLIGCQKCHRKLDDNKIKREERFMELRGPE